MDLLQGARGLPQCCVLDQTQGCMQRGCARFDSHQPYSKGAEELSDVTMRQVLGCTQAGRTQGQCSKEVSLLTTVLLVLHDQLMCIVTPQQGNCQWRFTHGRQPKGPSAPGLTLGADVPRAAGHMAASAEDHIAAPLAAPGSIAGAQPQRILCKGSQPYATCKLISDMHVGTSTGIAWP